ncbi:uncharacterized protein A4U43_C01F13660 [Asparagus officinalis]|uniref:Late embryogenesis abundant protein LEA-2 subgroup domain-containing protein n=1 Tax=Asparagus officinalis TaxID=4686 RepID=A0A5P1FSV4_ASPOF|nr:uncharacterized protein A4U43_C01F13660 [Asparagus officinalis]
MNATVDLLADRIGLTNATGEVLEGRMLKLRTFTDISGRVNVWGIYKRDLEIRVNCSLTVDVGIGAQEIKNKVCVADVRYNNSHPV